MTFQEVVKALWAGHVPPVPLNGKPPRYSASTVKQIKTCERLHFFEQVVGIEPPRREALAIGTKVHAHVERALKKGVVLRVGPGAEKEERLAATGLVNLPVYGTPGLRVEESFEMATWPKGPMFTGTIDLHIAPPEAREEDETGVEAVELWDHKTTGNWARYSARGWALTEETLPDDIQCVSYSTRLLRRYNAKRVDAKWLYYQKEGGPSVVVAAKMEREETFGKWREQVLPLIGTMHEQHTERPSLRIVKPNHESCEAFGGCPHRSYCVDYIQEKAMGNRLVENIKKGHAAATATDEPEAPAINPPKTEKAKTALQELKGVTTGRTQAAEPNAAAKPSPFAGLADGAEKIADKPKLKLAEKIAESQPETKPAKAETKAPKTETKAAEGETKTEAAKLGYALFLACEPVVSKRSKVLLADILAPLEAGVAKAHKVEHIGLVKFDAEHHLCAALDAWLEEHADELDGTNVVVGRSLMHRSVAERVLLSRAMAASQGVA